MKSERTCLFNLYLIDKTYSILDSIFGMFSRISRTCHLHRCASTRPLLTRIFSRLSSSYQVPFISPKLTDSYYYHGSNVPLLNHTIGQHLDILAETHPNHPCYVFKGEGDKRYTYKSFLDEVNALATGLIDLGFEKGDRLGVWLPNTSESCTITYAASKVGLIKVIYYSSSDRYETSGLSVLGKYQSSLYGT